MHLCCRGIALGALKGPFQLWHLCLHLNTPEGRWDSRRKDDLPAHSQCYLMCSPCKMESLCALLGLSSPLQSLPRPLVQASQQHLSEALGAGVTLASSMSLRIPGDKGAYRVYITPWMARRMCTKGCDSTVGQPSVTTQGDSADITRSLQTPRDGECIGRRLEILPLLYNFLVFLPLFIMKRKSWRWLNQTQRV